MAEALRLYISSFWAWAGITVGAIVVLQGLANICEQVIGLIRWIIAFRAQGENHVRKN